jgi:hypothetical protein
MPAGSSEWNHVAHCIAQPRSAAGSVRATRLRIESTRKTGGESAWAARAATKSTPSRSGGVDIDDGVILDDTDPAVGTENGNLHQCSPRLARSQFRRYQHADTLARV